jgi:3-isopropylmalate/(R)-2-methylmalate dehydratase large subunit
MGAPQSLFDRLWESHLVEPETSVLPALLYVDTHLIHEVTSPQGFDQLRAQGIGVRRPERTLATLDHSTPTHNAGNSIEYHSPQARQQVEQLRINCREFGIRLLDWGDPDRGIVHVIGPELGLTQPGRTLVCGDSHTSTHGAFGALAFGIGTSEVGHVLATQCLLQRRPRTLRVEFRGRTKAGVLPKDLILHLIQRIGVGGATGQVIEFCGDTIRNLDMEGRMTICNMTIEAGARAGMIAPDEVTVDYLKDRPMVPKGEDFQRQAEHWLSLASDSDAAFDREMVIEAGEIVPTITYGTHPGMAVAIDQPVPRPTDANSRRALEYMGIEAGKPLPGHPVDWVFIGSCTNGRITDLREAAQVLAGRSIKSGVRMLVVPGSEQVRKQAEAEGLDRIFLDAGAEWRLPGCSMCLAMNGDAVPAGKTAVSTSNRNFQGRQGPGSRTLLASPATAAASAIAGAVADPRTLLECPEVAA